MAKWRSFFLAAAFLAASGSIAAAEGPARIGVVDMQRVLDNSQAGKTAAAELKTRGEKMETELQKKNAEIEELQRGYESRKMVMNRQKRDEAEREIRIKVTDLESQRQKYTEEFRALEMKLASGIRENSLSVIQEIAQKEGFDVVLEKREAGIIYVPADHDLTDKLIQAFNTGSAPKPGN
jgi:outer membrane protein